MRDNLDVSAFHIAVPQGVSAINVDFQYLSPTAANQGRIVATPDLASIQWIANSMYPAGYYVRDIPIQASVIVPAGWHVATALRPSGQSANRVDYPVTSYEILMDSPMIAGAHYRAFKLSPDVTLDVIADNEQELAAKPDQIAVHERLVRAGSQGVRRAALRPLRLPSDDLRLSRRRAASNITAPAKTERIAAISPTGTMRFATATCCRTSSPTAGTASSAARPTSGRPISTRRCEDGLLWVYEGQTQYWGYVLGARSGMLSKQDTLDALARDRRGLQLPPPGRNWRPLVDTTNDPIIAQPPRRSLAQLAAQRGLLQRGPADLARRRHASSASSPAASARSTISPRPSSASTTATGASSPTTSTTLSRRSNGVQPYDWRSYLQQQVYERRSGSPARGDQRGRLQAGLHAPSRPIGSRAPRRRARATS